jgi:hypothetical protein
MKTNIQVVKDLKAKSPGNLSAPGLYLSLFSLKVTSRMRPRIRARRPIRVFRESRRRPVFRVSETNSSNAQSNNKQLTIASQILVDVDRIELSTSGCRPDVFPLALHALGAIREN